ncbi:MAG: hypothetical protein VKO26_00365 [Cyanobacteriota bacterium]|nr:hypothetical protein [Cyanobacteriota bacterium]
MVQRQTGLIRSASVVLVCGIALLLLVSGLHRHFNPPLSGWGGSSTDSSTEGPHWIHERYVPFNDIKPKAAAPPEKTISVGMQIQNIYNLSIKDRTFNVEGWYWLKWPETVNTIIKENEISQEKIVDFINQINSDSLLIEVYQPNPERLADGNYWQSFHFSGSFYIENLQLRAFPFDDLQLPIAMELGPDALSCYPGNRFGCFSLAFDNASNPRALGQHVGINSYTLIGSESQEFLHQYRTNFGRGAFDAYGAIKTNLVYRAEFAASFWIYIFPLLILVGVSIAAPSLPGSLGDVRLAIPTTILLTLIFLQMGYKAELPALEYVSYLDWIYIYAYAVSAMLFLLFCWGTNAHTNAEGQDNEAQVLRRINRVDVLVQGVAFGGLLLVLGSGLLFQP